MIKRRSAAGADGTQRSTGTFVEHATASFIESGDEQQPSAGGTVRLRSVSREAVDGNARDQRQQRSTLVLDEDSAGTGTGTEPLPVQRVPTTQQPAAGTGAAASPKQPSSQAAAKTPVTVATTAFGTGQTPQTSTDSPSPARQPQQFVTPKEILLPPAPVQQQPANHVNEQGPAKPSRRPAGGASAQTPTNDPSDYALMQRSMLEGNFDFVRYVYHSIYVIQYVCCTVIVINSSYVLMNTELMCTTSA